MQYKTKKELTTITFRTRPKKIGWAWEEYPVEALVVYGPKGGIYFAVQNRDMYWMDGRGKQVWEIYTKKGNTYIKKELIAEWQIQGAEEL